ncbi:MAG: radical SAM protein [Ignavibacteria bacterium]|nr:radical SAM protein [Ignavibacteria bacterium]MBI3765660.1 radical SAM protein [Ignavibacteriales bacterium]
MNIERPLTTLYNILVLGAPIEAQLIVTRRCNLSCGYCFEYDNTSAPVPFEDLCRWIDSLHRLKVVHITLLGGEPLMHPQVADIVAYGRKHSTVSITTNGFLLSEKVIEHLNEAKLSHMQISIDTSKPDPSNYIQKSLKVLRPKLARLKKHARFDLHLAAVLCEHSRDEVKDLLHEAEELGIPMSLSVVHDEVGHVAITGEPYLELYDYYGKNSNHFGFSLVDYEYSRKLLEGKYPSWKCRAGARSLYVDEFGNVQLCASQRGRLNKPVEQYTWDDIRTQSKTEKGCEDGCAVDCVFRASQVDNDKVSLLRVLAKGFVGNGNH